MKPQKKTLKSNLNRIAFFFSTMQIFHRKPARIGIPNKTQQLIVIDAICVPILQPVETGHYFQDVYADGDPAEDHSTRRKAF